MLASLYVKDFAIVGETEIRFAAGLTVVTGETGAGKSLLIDALLLLTGARGDASSIRHGCERAELQAEFDLHDAPKARAWLVDAELDDETQCQLRRVIRAEGSSKCYINGRPVTVSQLKELGERLLEIHGQHEHQALLERQNQLTLLDAYGNHTDLLDQVAGLYKRWRAIADQIQQLNKGTDQVERAQFLEHQLSELEQYALSAVDLEALNAAHKRLANAGQLMQGATRLSELIDGDDEFSLLRLIARSQNEVAKLAELDPHLGPLRELIDNAQIQLSEAGDTLARYQNALELDPEHLSKIETHIGKLYELSRKHRVPMPDLKIREDELREELANLRNMTNTLADLDRERQTVLLAYAAAAARLSDARTVAAQRLSSGVSGLLGELGMAGGQFQVAIEAQNNAEPTMHGNERVEFLVSANPGHPLKLLRKVASGGELSRISLAIEVAALGLDDVATMVFDEVDSGIGGAVAEVVGQKLRRLGDKRQVLCVTHLPQVAAQGHQHLCVVKSVNAGSTETNIVPLAEKPRGEEIARMLGGIDITRETLAHAKQMLARAQA